MPLYLLDHLPLIYINTVQILLKEYSNLKSAPEPDVYPWIFIQSTHKYTSDCQKMNILEIKVYLSYDENSCSTLILEIEIKVLADEYSNSKCSTPMLAFNEHSLRTNTNIRFSQNTHVTVVYWSPYQHLLSTWILNKVLAEEYLIILKCKFIHQLMNIHLCARVNLCFSYLIFKQYTNSYDKANLKNKCW